MKLLIDADILVYQIASKNQTTFDGQPLFNLDNALRDFNDYVTEILRKTKFTDYLLCISSDTNYRKQNFPTYKTNRTTLVKPLGLKPLREYLLSSECWHPVKMVEDLEADDVIGIMASRDSNNVIYSLDKDLKTIPSKYYDMRREKVIDIDEHSANKYLYKQILTGDPVDGYKGCPRIGKVKAGKMIDECKSEFYMFVQLVRAYRKAYPNLTFEEVLGEIRYQAGQARILRKNDYDYKNKKVILWYPWRDFGNIKTRQEV